jgi:hypothetical protein
MRLLKLLLVGALLLGGVLPMAACDTLQDVGESIRDTID